MKSNPSQLCGKGERFHEGDNVVRWRDCPDCEGRGWFLINAFKTGGSNGAGGLHNMTQCPKCREAYHAHQIETAIPAPAFVLQPSNG